MEKIEGKEMFESIKELGHYSGIVIFFYHVQKPLQEYFLNRLLKLFNFCILIMSVIEI